MNKKTIITLFSCLLFSSCALTSAGGNIIFDSMKITSVNYDNKDMTLSKDNENVLENTLMSQKWKKDLNLIQAKDYEVFITAKVAFNNDNNFYKKGEYNFSYHLDLDEGYLIMDIVEYSSSQNAITSKLNNNILKKIRNIFNYQDAFELTIIDNNNFLLEKPSKYANNAQSEEPLKYSEKIKAGTNLIFKTTTLCDADVVMYVDDNIYSKGGTFVDGHLEFYFTMPKKNTVIKFQAYTPSYLYLHLSDFYPSIDFNSINKIRMEQGFIGVAPGSLRSISYSNDKFDIENTISMLSSMLTPAKDDICGGGYIEYTIYQDNNISFTFRFNNGMIDINGISYTIDCTFYNLKNSYLNCSAFLAESTADIYYNNEKVSQFNELDKLEFVECDYPLDANYSKYYLDTSFAKIYIHDSKTFEVTYKYYDAEVIYCYKLVGDVDFSNLFK